MPTCIPAPVPRGRAATWGTSVALAVVLGAPLRVEAQAEPTVLVVDAPPECTTTEAIVAEIGRLVGTRGPLVVPGITAVRVRIAAVEGGHELVLESESASGPGERRLHDPSCVALAEAAALVIAMLIDPDAALLAAANPPPPAPIASSSVLSTASAAQLRAELLARLAAAEGAGDLGSPFPPPPIDRGLPPVGLGAGAALDLGLLPQPSGAFFFEAVFRIDRFDFRFGGAFLGPPAEARVGAVSTHIAGGTGRLAGCVRPFDDTVTRWFGICLAVYGGVLVAQEAAGISDPLEGWQPGGLFTVAPLSLVLPVAPNDFMDFELLLELMIPVVSPRFEITRPAPEPATGVFAPEGAGFRGGFALHFDIRP